MKSDPTSLVETIAYIATMIGAIVAAVQGFLNRREIKPPTSKRRRRLKRDPEATASTLGEKISELAEDARSIKEQQADLSTALARHITDPNAHANGAGGRNG